MNAFRVLGLLLSAATMSCATAQAPFVRCEFQPDANSPALKTYAWVPYARPVIDDRRVGNRPLEERIRSAADRKLQSNGFSKALAAEASF